MKGSGLLLLAGLVGCHGRWKVASPQIGQTAPLICVVVVASDQANASLIRAAMEGCNGALESEAKR